MTIRVQPKRFIHHGFHPHRFAQHGRKRPAAKWGALDSYIPLSWGMTTRPMSTSF